MLLQLPEKLVQWLNWQHPNKIDEYTILAADHHFQRIAVEMLGPINKSASQFFYCFGAQN